MKTLLRGKRHPHLRDEHPAGHSTRSYQYSDENLLLKAGEWSYQSDPDGFLTNKTKSTNQTHKTQFFYSSRGELLEEEKANCVLNIT
jgi:hypothetical protein